MNMRRVLIAIYHYLFSFKTRTRIKEKYYASTWQNFLYKNQNNNNEYALIHNTDGLFFLGGGLDYLGVMGSMVREGITYATFEMCEYERLTKLYSKGSNNDADIFVDVGLNIGTTSIYFKRILDTDIRIIGFEPDYKMYKMVKANFILNDIEEGYGINHLGLGEKRGRMELYQHPENPGGNSLINSPTEIKEEVDIYTLDEYIAENNIEPQDIKYLWIDTEGYEPYVLFGAEKLMSSILCPVYIEFNPQVYRTINGLYKKYVEFLKKFFSGYISVQEAKIGEGVIHPIDDLDIYEDYQVQYGDVVLIK